MSYLPRPDAGRTAEDINEIYTITSEELRLAKTPEERRAVFRRGMLRSYEAGIDAQREILAEYIHDRPTPAPPPPPLVSDDEATDPGLLPPNPPPRKPLPFTTKHPREPKKR